jgi:molecular chaperone GrpE
VENESTSAPAGTNGQPEPAASDGEDFRSKYLYALAEVENTKARAQRRSDEATRSLKRRLLLGFLPVLDNLERALAHPDSPELRAGLDATLRAFESALATEGVTPVTPTAGKRFDPNNAEAIATQPAEGVPDETVLEETRRGYRMDGELLRPAHVVVAKNQ